MEPAMIDPPGLPDKNASIRYTGPTTVPPLPPVENWKPSEQYLAAVEQLGARIAQGLFPDQSSLVSIDPTTQFSGTLFAPLIPRKGNSGLHNSNE